MGGEIPRRFAPLGGDIPRRFTPPFERGRISCDSGKINVEIKIKL
jgi:hypothetical protein